MWLWWVSGFLGVIVYVMVLTIWGLGCVQKGRWIWFGLGFLLPILWIVGYYLPSPSSEQPT